jgi:hypothetical protein
MHMERLKLLDEVALLRDQPGQGLIRGHVGTVVEILSSGVVEAEFSDNKGRTYATAVLPIQDVVRLRYAPFEQLA